MVQYLPPQQAASAATEASEGDSTWKAGKVKFEVQRSKWKIAETETNQHKIGIEKIHQ
jgi:hypothetical protein